MRLGDSSLFFFFRTTTISSFLQLPDVSEVLLHVDVDEHSDPNDKSQPLRPINDITLEVKKLLSEQEDIKGVSHVLIHYVQKRLLVEAQIIVDDSKTVREAKMIAEEAKRKIEALKDVAEGHVDLELAHGHEWNSLNGKSGK